MAAGLKYENAAPIFKLKQVQAIDATPRCSYNQIQVTAEANWQTASDSRIAGWEECRTRIWMRLIKLVMSVNPVMRARLVFPHGRANPGARRDATVMKAWSDGITLQARTMNGWQPLMRQQLLLWFPKCKLLKTTRALLLRALAVVVMPAIYLSQ